MDNQLAEIMARRKRINTGREPAPCRTELTKETKDLNSKMQGNFNPYTAFPEIGRKQIKDYEKTFKSYDSGRKGYLNIEDVKKMMEFVGKPQTHLSIKKLMSDAMEREDETKVLEHPVNTLSFFGFLSLFENPDELEDENSVASGIHDISKQQDINVHETGVTGARDFFSAKINQQSKSNTAEQEIRREQAQRKKTAEEERERKENFKNRMALFNNK